MGAFLSAHLPGPSCCLKVEKVNHSHYRCRLAYFPNTVLSFFTCLLSTPTSGCPLDALTTIKLEKKVFSVIISITGKDMVKLGHFYIVGCKKNYNPLKTNMTSHFKSYKKMVLLFDSIKPPLGICLKETFNRSKIMYKNI